MKILVVVSVATLILAACAANRPQTQDALLTSGTAGPQFCLMESAEVVAKKVSKYFDGCFINGLPTTESTDWGYVLPAGKGSHLAPASVTVTPAGPRSHSYQFSMAPIDQGFQGSVYYNDEQKMAPLRRSGYVMTVTIIKKNEPSCQTLIQQTAVKDAAHPFAQFEQAVRTGKRPKGCRCVTKNCD